MGTGYGHADTVPASGASRHYQDTSQPREVGFSRPPRAFLMVRPGTWYAAILAVPCSSSMYTHLGIKVGEGVEALLFEGPQARRPGLGAVTVAAPRASPSGPGCR